MVRIKICGITRSEDAQAAAAAGVDAIGLVFVAGSRREIAIEQAARICRDLPPFVGRVGLFMDADADAVRRVLDSVPLNWLQFHGREDQAFCRQFGRPWIKALAMGEGGDGIDKDFDLADAVLLDSHTPGGMGGSGESFDWNRVPAMRRPWILAGGLHAGNVAAACRRLKPDAVDVSSGVEVNPGVKSDKLMKDFVEAVKNG